MGMPGVYDAGVIFDEPSSPHFGGLAGGQGRRQVQTGRPWVGTGARGDGRLANAAVEMTGTVLRTPRKAPSLVAPNEAMPEDVCHAQSPPRPGPDPGPCVVPWLGR